MLGFSIDVNGLHNFVIQRRNSAFFFKNPILCDYGPLWGNDPFIRDERNIVRRELGFFAEKIWVLSPIYDARETWAMSPFRDVDKVRVMSLIHGV